MCSTHPTLPCPPTSPSRHGAPGVLLATTDEVEHALESTRRRRRSNAPSPEPEEHKCRQQMQGGRLRPERTPTRRDRQHRRSRILSSVESLGVAQRGLNEPRSRPWRSCNVAAGGGWRRRVGAEPGRGLRGAGARVAQARVGAVGVSAGRIVVGMRDRAAAEMMWTRLHLQGFRRCWESVETIGAAIFHALWESRRRGMVLRRPREARRRNNGR
ncbi:hypothetical protein MCOR25_007047 [Pyricularia grisea]|uniref:Uncharacterized protein n=1 Tax=Pyricularia grisea TaxID=148305 RepID=A0A6P8AZA8_PYRGI|nr:hypothetical protein PgNI_10855 [Pyricularia grisea]KAI6359474.1 hypothetical protein MCOR25_007047 [Pyricularia grisea]TLD07581.1 hypothetical protein PgNI_10855 [Pyricularia grisea]